MNKSKSPVSSGEKTFFCSLERKQIIYEALAVLKLIVNVAEIYKHQSAE